MKGICYEKRPHYIVILHVDIERLPTYLQNTKQN